MLIEMQVEKAKITRQEMVSVGFSGESKPTISEIDLPVRVKGVNKYTHFYVLEESSWFNAILGRP